ncbi:MAG: alpha/beta hydrolase [Acidobacteriota bacterium]
MEFERQTLTVNGVRIVMLVAGHGPPLLFLHGAGTWHGFDFAETWARHHRVLIPFHPGLGESDDSPLITTMHDYVMHYLELIDQLNLPEVHLVGLSMGGWMAAAFTEEHRRRVRRLVLVAPAGLEVPGYPLTDFSKIAPQDILEYLTENVPQMAAKAPATPDAAWLAARDRDGAALGRLLQGGVNDPKFIRYLHRITVPTMLVWGDKDRTTPIQQAEAWVKYVPGLRVLRVPDAGHMVLDETPEAAEAIGSFLQSS